MKLGTGILGINTLINASVQRKMLKYMDEHQMNVFHASTALMIAPSCKINIAKALITNFHQPKSTLLLLVSALIGDKWKEAYQYALNNDFRFLSYGDSCLFLNS